MISVAVPNERLGEASRTRVRETRSHGALFLLAVKDNQSAPVVGSDGVVARPYADRWLASPNRPLNEAIERARLRRAEGAQP